MKLILFARPPIPGKTKTRLIPKFGKRGAQRIYLSAINYLASQIAQSTFNEVCICVSPPASHPYLRQLAKHHGWQFSVQKPGGLGKKMFSVFNEARHRNMSIAIIGADCVGLDVNSLNRINRHCTVGASAAICPADDGGYVLLAGRALPYRVFRGVRWGTEKVLPQTLERFHRADIELFISNPSWDLDLPCDVIRFAQKLNSNPMFRSLKG